MHVTCAKTALQLQITPHEKGHRAIRTSKRAHACTRPSPWDKPSDGSDDIWNGGGNDDTLFLQYGYVSKRTAFDKDKPFDVQLEWTEIGKQMVYEFDEIGFSNKTEGRKSQGERLVRTSAADDGAALAEKSSNLHVSGCGGTTVGGKQLKATFISNTGDSLDTSCVSDSRGQYITCGLSIKDGNPVQARFSSNDKGSFRAEDVAAFIESQDEIMPLGTEEQPRIALVDGVQVHIHKLVRSRAHCMKLQGVSSVRNICHFSKICHKLVALSFFLRQPSHVDLSRSCTRASNGIVNFYFCASN